VAVENKNSAVDLVKRQVIPGSLVEPIGRASLALLHALNLRAGEFKVSDVNAES
jgi:hypothetical protein